MNENQTDILSEARCLVDGDRNDSYGDPNIKYLQIAKVWSVLLKTDITPEQVVLAMCAVKMVRASNRNSLNRDDLVDLCGYALILSRLTEGK